MSIITSEMFEFKQGQMQAMFLSKLIPMLVDIQETKLGSKKALVSRVEFEPHKIKTEWLQLWWDGLQRLIPEAYRMALPSSVEEAEKLLAKISLNQTQKQLTLIDCVEFAGYYASMKEKKTANLHKVKMNDHCKKEGEKLVAHALGIPDSTVDRLHKMMDAARADYQETMKWFLKVIMGGGVVVGVASLVAAPIVAGIIGTAVLGLHGAAAASAILAWVGFGSLASGGLGMAGGTIIITGAGVLIGLAGGGLASKMLHVDKASAIRNAIQLEALICVFLLAEKEGCSLAGQLYDEARSTYQKIFSLRDDVVLKREDKDVQEMIVQMQTQEGTKFNEKQVRAVLVNGLSESLTVYGKMLDRIRKKLVPKG